MDKLLTKKLQQNSYRALTNLEVDIVVKELEEIYEDKYNFPDNVITTFDSNLSLNDKIYGHIEKDLHAKQQKYFLYMIKGKKVALKIEDTKPQLYICSFHPRYPRKCLPIIKYLDYKKLINEKEKMAQEKTATPEEQDEIKKQINLIGVERNRALFNDFDPVRLSQYNTYYY